MSSCASGRYPRPRLELTISFSSSAEWPPPCARVFQLQRAGDDAGGALHHHHEWQRHAVKDQQRRRHDRGQPVGLGHRQILGNHFAQHHVQVRDHQEGNRQAGAVQNVGRQRTWPAVQPGNQQLVQGVLAGPAQPQAGQRDAHLRYRQQPPGIRKQVESGLRAGGAILRHLPQARMPHRKQRHLGAREEAVHRDQQRDQNDSKWVVGHSPPTTF